jgi:phosphohistidine phosphatase
MKTIYLVRHAKAEVAKDNIEDIDRSLSGRGERDANEMGKRLLEQGIKPDLIISSSAIRTTSTALILARNIGYEASKIELRPDLYEATVEKYINALKSLDDKISTVMLVGHNPTITDTANALTSPFRYDFVTCTVLGLTTSIKSWKDLNKAAELMHDFPKSGQS